MRIAPFCLVLALLSPVTGNKLRGRKLAEEATTAPEPSGADFPQRVTPQPTPRPTPAPVAPTAPTAPSAVVLEELDEEPIEDWKDTDTADADADTAGAAADDIYDTAKHKGDGTGSKSGSKSGTGGSKGKSGSSRGSSDDPDNGGADGLCQSFCHDYVNTCEAANAFFNPDEPRGAGNQTRRLIAGEQIELPRLSGGVFESVNDCLRKCANYPRPFNPADYIEPTTLGVNSIGDTFWCRQTHLRLAASGQPYAQQVHCPAASPSGGGICTNIPIDTFRGINATAYEFIRAGAETARHLGYCQMYYNDLVADCTSAGIDDRVFSMALAQIPIDTEIIILNNNVGKRNPANPRIIEGEGITEIPGRIFRGLICPECITGLIIDDGNVATLNAESFTALRNLRQLSLNMQRFDTLPAGLLTNNVNMSDFSVYNTPSRGGLLTSIPNGLFERNPWLQRIVISGHPNLSVLPTCTFCNQLPGDPSILKILIMSNNGFTNQGVLAGTFNNLGDLEHWDFSGNQLTRGNAGWFSAGWARSLRKIYLHDNPLTFVDDNMFDLIPNLEVVTLHDTNVIGVPMGAFDFNPNLITYTISPLFSG